MINTEPKSDCCNASTSVQPAKGATCYYVCNKCLNACGMAVQPTPSDRRNHYMCCTCHQPGNTSHCDDCVKFCVDQTRHPVDSKLHDSVGLSPAYRELRDKISNEVVNAALRLKIKPTPGNYKEAVLSGREIMSRHQQGIDEIMQLFAAHLQTAEKAYGGCHNCYGKGYATRQAFGNGRTDIPQDPMVFCKCGRGKQLEELIGRRVQAAVDKADEKITIDDIAGYWNDKDQHVRYVVAIKKGEILKHWKVTDDELKKYPGVGPYGLTHAQIEAYALQQLKQTSETKPIGDK